MKHPTLEHLTPDTCSKPSPLPGTAEHIIFTPNLTTDWIASSFLCCTDPLCSALLSSISLLPAGSSVGSARGTFLAALTKRQLFFLKFHVTDQVLGFHSPVPKRTLKTGPDITPNPPLFPGGQQGGWMPRRCTEPCCTHLKVSTVPFCHLAYSPPTAANVSQNSLQHDLFHAASVSHAAAAGSPPPPQSDCDVVVLNMTSFFQ